MHLAIKNSQLICDPENGDCFRACLTSVLGIANRLDLPNGKNWFIDWLNWLSQYGISLHYEGKACWQEGFWIASVPSKNFNNATHSIIMNGQEVYFDPSPKIKYEIGENLLGKDIVKGGWHLRITNLTKVYGLQLLNKEKSTNKEKLNDSKDYRRVK
jgi:hypothetical protein